MKLFLVAIAGVAGYFTWRHFYPAGVIMPAGTIILLPNGSTQTLTAPTSTANLPEGTGLNEQGTVIVHNGMPFNMGG